jgi:hypothetical protein
MQRKTVYRQVRRTRSTRRTRRTAVRRTPAAAGLTASFDRMLTRLTFGESALQTARRRVRRA